MSTDDPDPPLAALAAAYGVATSYDDQLGRPVPVGAGTVRAVLAALGVDAASPAAVDVALEQARLAPYRRLVPPFLVTREGVGLSFEAHPPAGTRLELRLELEDGTVRTDFLARTVAIAPVAVDGRPVDTVPVGSPADLPLGWHRLVARAGDREQSATVLVAPRRLAPLDRRAWGWMVQLYALRSHASWGLGDLADLARLATWSAGQGAGLLLCNPLHAVAPVAPMQPSPYFPASRRFVNPVYLRIAELPEYAAAPAELRARVDALAPPLGGDEIDRDTAWAAKRAAAELLFTQAYGERPPPPEDAALREFATWCALTERHGPDWRDWPQQLRRPDAPAVAVAAGELSERVAFHGWLQRRCDDQLAAAQAAALGAGMPLGIVHDLAVGTDPAGADAWALQDALALGTRIGAPPDEFNQQGQDWGMPPWRPDRLADLGYAPFRDMLRAVLRHAGGVRIDHVLGLFRLWWVPPGAGPDGGSYVRYDDEALLGVLALEAQRAGAVVIGEDLGTVEPRVADALRERGVLGSSVLWFERDDDGPRPLAGWRAAAAASVTTHDLPTAVGFLRGTHVTDRADAGLLRRPVARVAAEARRERDELVAFLEREGLVGPGAGEEQLVVAMHAALTRTPSRLVLAAPGDAVGDLRQPNLPGTTDAYPNWRLPVATPRPDGSAEPLTIEDLQASPGIRRVAAALDSGLAERPGGAGAPRRGREE